MDVAEVCEHRCRVLYVEDTPEDQRMLTEAVGMAGVPLDIIPASTPGSALDCLAGEFQAVVLDWNLPATDGTEFLTEIREKQPKMPVMILTGEPATVDLSGALELGAETVVAKPLTLDHWVRLARLIHGFCEDVQAAQ